MVTTRMGNTCTKRSFFRIAGYSKDATVQLFIVNFFCFLSECCKRSLRNLSLSHPPPDSFKMERMLWVIWLHISHHWEKRFANSDSNLPNLKLIVSNIRPFHPKAIDLFSLYIFGFSQFRPSDGLQEKQRLVLGHCPGGGGWYYRNFWVGMCCRSDPGTLHLYQS